MVSVYREAAMLQQFNETTATVNLIKINSFSMIDYYTIAASSTILLLLLLMMMMLLLLLKV